MSAIYALDLASTAVTTAVDLVEVSPADDRLIEIVAIFLFQTTELGDAAEEILPIQIIRGHTSTGSGGGSAPTARPLKRNAAAFGSTIDTIFNTTIASAGTTHTLLTDGWNVRLPYVFHPVADEEYPDASQGDTTIVVRLPSAPTDSITMRGCVWVRET